MTIWTKSSDRMPPDTYDEFIFRFTDDKKLSHFCHGRHCRFVGGYDIYEWTPYTPELWRELNNA